MVLIDLEYFPKLTPTQVGLFRGILLNSSHCSIKDKFCSVKRKFYSVKAEFGAAQVYGLNLGLSNLTFSSCICDFPSRINRLGWVEKQDYEIKN